MFKGQSGLPSQSVARIYLLASARILCRFGVALVSLAGCGGLQVRHLALHATSSMTGHYTSGDIGRLINLSNRVLARGGTQTILRVAHG